MTPEGILPHFVGMDKEIPVLFWFFISAPVLQLFFNMGIMEREPVPADAGRKGFRIESGACRAGKRGDR